MSRNWGGWPKPQPVNLKAMLAAYKAAKANPAIKISTGVYEEGSWSADQFFAWFHKCLAEKINASDPRFPRGRKADEEYQVELMRLGRYIGNRIVIDWIAPVLGTRVRGALQHRLRSEI